MAAEIDLFTAAQLAEILGCDEVTVERRTTSGDLPGLKIGRSWVFPAGATIQRLNELALEQAAKRRAERAASAAAPPPPHAVSVPVQPQRGRRAPLPVLPQLG